MPAEEGDKMTELPSSANGTAAVSHHSAASRPRSTLLSVHTIGKNDLGQPFLDRSRGDPENASKTSKVSRVSGLSRVSKLGSLLARAAGRYDEGDDDEDPALAVFFLFVSHQNHIFHANLEDNFKKNKTFKPLHRNAFLCVRFIGYHHQS